MNIASPASPASPRFKRHFLVLGLLGLAAAALSIFVWFDATAGYAQDGVIAGADLRSDMIQIVWWELVGFAIASTAVYALLRGRAPALRYGAAYGVGIAAAVALMPLLDKMY